MNVFKQFKIAVVDVKRYSELIYLKTGSLILYIILLLLINLIGLAATLLPSYIQSGGISKIVEDYLPEFSIEDGILDMETVDFTDDEQSIRIYINTESDDFPFAQARGYTYALIASPEYVYISNGIQQETIYHMEEFNGLNRAAVVNFFSDTRVEILIVCGFFAAAFLLLGLSLFVNCIINCCIAVFANKITVKASLNFWQIFRICVYAYTLPILLNCVSMFFGINIYQVPIVVAFVYIYWALKYIKNDNCVVIAHLE